MAAGGSTTVVVFALTANLGIAVAKFAAAAYTGSSAMVSEGIHSLVDSSNQGLMLFGIARSKRPPDEKHPFGYSKELYFWAFVVAIVLFALGAGFSIYEGYQKLLHPHPINNVHIIYAVLGVAIFLEGIATWKALKEFNKRRGNRSFLKGLRQSKDPALFAILLEDLAAIAGLIVAGIGVTVAVQMGIEEADGLASIAIGVILACVSVFMALEVKSLIIGEAANTETQRGIMRLFKEEMGEGKPILAINEIRTMHLGPSDVLVAASVDFGDSFDAAAVEATTERLETAVKNEYPEIRRLFLEAQSQEAHRAAIEAEARHEAEIVDTEPEDVMPETLSAGGVPIGDGAGGVANKMAPQAAQKPADYVTARPMSRKGRKKAKRKK